MNKIKKVIITIVTVLSAILLLVVIFFSDQILSSSLTDNESYLGSESEIKVEIKVPETPMVFDGDENFNPNLEMTAIDENGKDISSLISSSVTDGKTKNEKKIVYSINDPRYQFATATRDLLLKNYSSPSITVTATDISIDSSEFDSLLLNLINKNQISADDGYGNDITQKIYIDTSSSALTADKNVITFGVTNVFNDTAKTNTTVNITGDVSSSNNSSIILSTSTISLQKDTPFDPFAYIVSAIDETGTDAKSLVQIENNVNLSTPGQYKVVYYLLSSASEKTAIQTLTVVITE